MSYKWLGKPASVWLLPICAFPQASQADNLQLPSRDTARSWHLQLPAVSTVPLSSFSQLYVQLSQGHLVWPSSPNPKTFSESLILLRILEPAMHRDLLILEMALRYFSFCTFTKYMEFFLLFILMLLDLSLNSKLT